MARIFNTVFLPGGIGEELDDFTVIALFYEFKETGSADKMGYQSPSDLRRGYPSFFLNFVRPHIGSALKYWQVTDEGKDWVSSLNYHVFSQSHKAELEKSGIELLSEITKIQAKKYKVEDLIRLIMEKICIYNLYKNYYKIKANKQYTLTKTK